MDDDRDESHPHVVARESFFSRNEDEVTEFIRRMYVGSRCRFDSVGDDACYEVQTATTDTICADRVTSTIDYRGITDPFDYYLFFTFHGHGSMRLRSPAGEMLLADGDAAFYPLGVPIEFELRQLHAQVIRLPAQRLDQLAHDITGLPGTTLRFTATTPISRSMLNQWRSVSSLAQGALMADPGVATPLLVEEMARTVAVTALHTFPNTTMTHDYVPGPGAMAPAALRRAVEFIETHAHQPIRVSDIAAAAGTSARALQHAFRRHHDTTPLEYLRQVRLEHAHRDLQSADPSRGDTLERIAAYWGFSNLPQFSRRYHAHYRQDPRETLLT